MQNGKRIAIALAATMVMSIAAPAYATHGGVHPTFRTETDYMTCLASNRVQNVGRLQGEVPTWSTAEPTQSLQGGGGCVQYENLLSNANPVNPYDLVFTGSFTGNVKTITFELYYANAPQASVPEYYANANLMIDGGTVHTATQFTFPPTPAGSLEKIVFSYTKVDLLAEAAPEEGDGATSREFTLTLSSFNEQQMFFAWGATDAPTKVTFNAPTITGTKLPVG